MKEERVCCSCGHKEGEHKDGTYTNHPKKSRPCMLAIMVPEGEGDIKVLKDVPQWAGGSIVSRGVKPWGCTKCSCIAFRLEEARLLR